MRNDIPLRIVFEDEYLIVVEKREGLLSVGTHKGKEEVTAHSLLNNYVRNTAPRRGRYAPSPRVFIVHRLDRETSGLMVFAKSEEIKFALQENWDEAVTCRRYVAVLNGCPAITDVPGKPASCKPASSNTSYPQTHHRNSGTSGTAAASSGTPDASSATPAASSATPAVSGTIRSWLKENSAFVVYSSPRDNGGQLAITHYKVLESNPARRKTLMELELDTGRKNQIRVHMQEMGCPIYGDKKYFGGNPQHLAESKKARRLYLHAHTLNFIHPVTGKEMKFTTGIPRSFTAEVISGGKESQTATEKSPTATGRPSGNEASPRTNKTVGKKKSPTAK